jgi:uncharacterized protein YeaO (DUF488 family)
MKSPDKRGQNARGRIQLKRAYEPAQSGDGLRVLVDRLWPRGLHKDAARIDLWLKEIAPSKELRQWFGHDPARWEGFQQRYRAELRDRTDLLGEIEGALHEGPVTLVFAASDAEHNNAVVLRDVLEAGHGRLAPDVGAHSAAAAKRRQPAAKSR